MAGNEGGGLMSVVRVNITEDLEVMTCVMKAGLHSERSGTSSF